MSDKVKEKPIKNTKSKKKKASSPISQKKKDVIPKLENKIAELDDKHLRLKAEFDNYRRRKNEEISSLLRYDGENVIKGFFPILDDLHRMIESSEESEDSLLDGIKIVESKIEKYLDSLEVKPFGEIGDEMDPEFHDAMMTQTDKAVENNLILQVFEKGYTYRDKVIRHARVIVNKK